MGLTWKSPTNSTRNKSARAAPGASGPPGRNYSKPKAKVKRKAVAPAQGSPHQSNRDAVRPATPIVSTAKATANTDNKITKSPLPTAKIANSPPPEVKKAISVEPGSHPSQKAKAALEGKDVTKESKPNILAIGAAEESNNNAVKPAVNPITKVKEEKGFFSSLKDAAGLLFDDPRTEESGRYNQKYWAERLAEGKAAGNKNIQAELAAEQAGQGGASKSYSQEKVPGYFEPLDHPSQKKIATLPVDTASSGASDLDSVNDQIKTETDPVKLKALHTRRLMLMRMNSTNTKFAGLLDDADTKRSNLMSIG